MLWRTLRSAEGKSRRKGCSDVSIARARLNAPFRHFRAFHSHQTQRKYGTQETPSDACLVKRNDGRYKWAYLLICAVLCVECRVYKSEKQRRRRCIEHTQNKKCRAKAHKQNSQKKTKLMLRKLTKNNAEIYEYIPRMWMCGGLAFVCARGKILFRAKFRCDRVICTKIKGSLI